MLVVFSASLCSGKLASRRKCVYVVLVTGAGFNQLLYAHPPDGHRIQKVSALSCSSSLAPVLWFIQNCLSLFPWSDQCWILFLFCSFFFFVFFVLYFFLFSTTGQRQHFLWPFALCYLMTLPCQPPWSVNFRVGSCDHYHSSVSWSGCLTLVKLAWWGTPVYFACVFRVPLCST